MDTRVPETSSFWSKKHRKALERKSWGVPNQLVRMRSPVQIRIAAPKTPENLGFWGFFVAKSCFTVRVKNPDPHRDTHAETAGKDKRAPDGKICLPVRFLLLLTRLYNLSQDAAHSLGGLVLLLPRGVGVGAQGEPGIVVPGMEDTVLTSTPFWRAVVAKV